MNDAESPFFALDGLKHVYVSAHRRGFMAIADVPMCVDGVHGQSGNNVIVGVKRVVLDGGNWAYADEGLPVYWLRRAWDGAVALTGAEPWRVYRLDAEEVRRRLLARESTDDVRGFEHRHEPWQAGRPEGDGFLPLLPAEADTWQRADSWRAVRGTDGSWRADGSACSAADEVIEESPRHFDPLPGNWPSSAEAMAAIDAGRPWA